MQIAFRIFSVIFAFAFGGCVTFNSLDFEKSEVANNQNLCVNLELKEPESSSIFNKTKLGDRHREMRINQINRTLKNLKIDADCASANAKKLVVITNDKTSLMMPIFAGITSIFTVLSLAVIPTYYSGNMEIILMDGDKQLLSREFSFSTMIWLPLVVKQWQDDTKAFDLYQVDARSAILGLEIGNLLVEYTAIEREK